MNYTKRQITESKKRYELIHNLLSNKANITETGISWKEGKLYFNEGYKEHVLMTFKDYKELKQGQKYLIQLLNAIDKILISNLIKLSDME